jgi:hypothetical protein
MLNKDQAFLINEFIRKNATRNLWEVSDKLYTLISEIKKIEELPQNNETEIACQNIKKLCD